MGRITGPLVDCAKCGKQLKIGEIGKDAGKYRRLSAVGESPTFAHITCLKDNNVKHVVVTPNMRVVAD